MDKKRYTQPEVILLSVFRQNSILESFSLTAGGVVGEIENSDDLPLE